MLKKQKNDEIRLHYKMYKSGKIWLFSAIATFSLGTGLLVGNDINIHASDTITTNEKNSEQESENQDTNNIKTNDIDKVNANSQTADNKPDVNNTPAANTSTNSNEQQDKTNNVENNEKQQTQNSNNNKTTESNQLDTSTTTPDNSKNNKVTNTDIDITTKKSDTENKNVTENNKLSNNQQVKDNESNQNNPKQTDDLNTSVINENQKDKVQTASSQSAKAEADITIPDKKSETDKQVSDNSNPVVTNNAQESIIPNTPITTTTEIKQNDNNDQSAQNTTNDQPEIDSIAAENNNNLPKDALKITTPTNINIANTNLSADDQRNKNVNLAAENTNNTDDLTGTWGTVNWAYDQNNKILSLDNSGTLGTRNETGSPFNDQQITQNVKEITINAPIKLPVDSSNLFTMLQNLTTINGLNKIDSSNVKNMDFMFFNDNKLTDLDVSNWDTSNVTSMRSIFQGCGSLKYLNVGGKFAQNTGNVTNMSYMFCGLFTSGSPFDGPTIPRIGLTEITGIEQLDTHNVTDMSFMFNGDQLLNNLNVSNFNTENVTNMEAMFKFVYVSALNLNNFNTDKVTNMKEMFSTDNLLNSLDLSSFNTRNVTDMTNMLENTVVLTYDDDNQTFVSFGLWQLILGKDTVLNNTVGLTNMVTGTLIPPTIDLPASGLWQELGTGDLPDAPYNTYSNNYSPNGQRLTAYTLMDGNSHAGTWVWAVDLSKIDGESTNTWYANSEKSKNWTPEDEINSLTNPDGSKTINKEQIKQAISDGILTVQYETDDGKQVTEDSLRTTPGKYNVIYNWYGSPNFSYQGKRWYYKTFTCVITVKGTKTVTEIGTGSVNVKYQYADGKTAAPTATKDATFQRTNIVDDTTGAVISYGEWSPATTSVSVNSPTIKGYKPNQQTISASLTANQKQTIIVTYTANKETAKVQYIDDTTGKTIDGVTDTLLTGNYGQAIDKSAVDAEIQKLENQGYHYVNANIPATFDFDGEVPTYSVHFNHATGQVTDSTTGSLTVHYQYADKTQAHDNQVITAKFTRTGTKDDVTNEINWNDWTSTDNTKIDFTVPTITGYTPNQNQVISTLVPNTNDNLTIIYTADSESVQVNYVDEQGHQLAASDNLTGKYGDAYQTNPKVITGYHVIKTEGNVAGRYTTETPDVTYVYAPDEVTMTINYVDEHHDNQILKTTTITGVYGSDYSLNPEYQIENHKYTYGGESPVSGTFTQNGIINLPYYQTPTGVVNVQYEQVDNQGNPMGIFILPPATMSGYIGANYDILVQQVKNYNYLRASNNLTGIYGYNPQWATLFYQYVNPYTKGVVNVHYVDENGNPIQSNTSMSGKIGSSYEITPPDIPGYTFEKNEGNLTGQFTPVAQNVTLVYKKDAPVGTGVVNVNYVDENGNQIAEPITNSGSFGSKFKESPINITGYTYVKTEGSATGIYGQDAQTVTFVYQKNTPVTNGIVNINYVDENGNLIANSTSLTGTIGTAYQVTPKQLDGYTYVKAEGNLTGQYTDTAQNITLVYQAKTTPVTDGTVTVKYVDEQGNEIKTMQTLTGKIGSYYHLNPVEITGYTYEKTTGNLTGQYTKDEQIITLIYKKDVVSTVTITYVDQNGNQVAPEKTIQGKVASKYNVASPIIAGYATKQIMVSGEFMPVNQNIQVVYHQLDNPVVPPTDNNGNGSQNPAEPTTPIDDNDNNGSQTPVEPNIPTNKSDNGSQVPAEPTTSPNDGSNLPATKTNNQSNEVTPEISENNENTHQVNSASDDAQTTTTETAPTTSTFNKATALPQTGQGKDNGLLEMLGALLLSVLGIFGLNGFKKKKIK